MALTFVPLLPTINTRLPERLPLREGHNSILRRPLFATATPPWPTGDVSSILSDSRDPKKTPLHWRIPYLSIIWETITSRQLQLELRARYGEVYRTAFPDEIAVIVTPYDLVKAVAEDEDTFRTKGALPLTMRKLFGDDNIQSMAGRALRYERREAVKALFSEKTMPRYFEAARCGAERLIEKLLMPHESEEFKKGKGIDLVEESQRLAMWVVFTGMDADKNMHDERLRETCDQVFKLMRTVGTAVHAPPVWPILNNAIAAQRQLSTLFVQDVAKRMPIVREMIAKFEIGHDLTERTSVEYPDFLTYLITVSCRLLPETMTMEDKAAAMEVTRHLSVFLFGGYVTTGPGLAMTLFKVYSDPVLLQTLRDEQKSVNGPVTLEAVRQQMPLLAAVCNEVFRLWPPNTLMSRRANKDTSLGGHAIRKDELVMLDVWSAQTDASKFDDPFIFDYQRFIQIENGQCRASSKDLLCFSSSQGPHYCLGAALARMEVATAISMLIRNLDLTLNIKDLENGVLSSGTIVPKEGLYAKEAIKYDGFTES